MKWYFKVWKQYVDFSGRARRREYWMFFLFNMLIAFPLALVDAAMMSDSDGFGFLYPLYSLAVMLPAFAVYVRRLHDINKSGWWCLIGLVPLIGAIVLLLWLVRDGTQGPNRFGPDPKATNAPPLAAAY